MSTPHHGPSWRVDRLATDAFELTLGTLFDPSQHSDFHVVVQGVADEEVERPCEKSNAWNALDHESGGP